MRIVKFILNYYGTILSLFSIEMVNLFQYDKYLVKH